MSKVFEIYGDGLWRKEVGKFSIFISLRKIKTCCGIKEAYYWTVLKDVNDGYFYDGELVASGEENSLEEAKKAVEKYV